MHRVALGVGCLVLAGCARPSGAPGPTDAPAAEASQSLADAATLLASPASDAGLTGPTEAGPDATAEAGGPDATADAGVGVSGVASAASKPRPGKRRGVACSQSSECAAGLGCCETGFRGQCGGAYMPDVERAPCVMTHSCERAPCQPLSLPP